MKKRLRRKIESESGKIPAVDCLEESFHILRMNVWSLLPLYCIGTVPFVLGVIYFVNDMCQRSDAVRIIPEYAFYIAALFVWKNLFQSLFCNSVMDKLTMRLPVRLTYKDYIKITCYQGIMQPLALFVNIISVILFFPLPWTVSFFTTFTSLAASTRKSFMEILRSSFRNTLIYPAQNNLLFYMLCILAFMSGLNTAIMIFFIPWILKTFMGINTVFSNVSGFDLLLNLIFNSTFWSVVIGVVYITVDPLLKTAYTIRMFYAESIFKGFDILASLQRIKKFTASGKILPLCILFILFHLFSQKVAAGDNPSEFSADHTPAQLNKAIEKVLQRREYSWRLPPEPFDNAEANALFLFFDQFYETVAGWMDKLVKFIDSFFKKSGQRGNSGFANFISWISANYVTISIVLLVVILLCMFMIVSKRRKNILKTEAFAALKAEKPPDLNDENTTADSLKKSEWLNLAADLIAKGKLRLAIRAIFLASIATLADKEALTIAKYKTNLDYLRELERRHHTNSDAINAFNSNLNIFERIWYGDYKVNQSILISFRNNFDVISEKDE